MLGNDACVHCGKPKAEHFFCNGYNHGHCTNSDGSWAKSLYEQPKPVAQAMETVALNVALKFYGFGAPQEVIEDAVKLMLEFQRVVSGGSQT